MYCVQDSTLYAQSTTPSTYLLTRSSLSCMHLQACERAYMSTRAAPAHRSRYTGPLSCSASLHSFPEPTEQRTLWTASPSSPSPLSPEPSPTPPTRLSSRSGRRRAAPPTAASARTLIRAPSSTAALADHEAENFELLHRSFSAQGSSPRLRLPPSPLRSCSGRTFSSFHGKRRFKRCERRRLRVARMLAHHPMHASNYYSSLRRLLICTHHEPFTKTVAAAEVGGRRRE
ncbi:hypothetical protein K523DRAFT_113785 [Schizophyllum commune Tattone D]|nr:hypothetical protein K523DRAFT_113785 [Schizophyllum commune Tattone D]